MPGTQLTEPLQETLSLLDGQETGTPFTTSEVADEFDLGRRSAYERLDRLVELGYLETKKVGASGRVWWRPVDAGPAPTDSPREFARLVSNLPGMVYRCLNEPDWPMSFVSAAASEITGYDPEQIISGDVSWGTDVVHPDDRETVRETVESRVADGEQFSMEYRILTPTDEVRWVRERGYPVAPRADDTADEDVANADMAEPQVLEGVVTDITVERRSKQELVEREQQFRSLVNATEEYAIFMLDSEGTVQTWNDGAERIKGYDREDIIGEHFSLFYTEEDRADDIPERNLVAAAHEGEIQTKGWRTTADGSRFWANITISAIYDEDGDVTGYAKVTRDMTDRREREQQVRRERDVVERTFQASPVGLCVVSRDGVERVNDRAEQVYDNLPDGSDSPSSPLPSVYDADGEPVYPSDRPSSRVFETGEPVVDWECYREDDDGTVWFSVSAVPICDVDGEVERVVIAFEDITQLKQQSRRLERQRNALEAELDEVFERVEDAFFALDTDWRFTHINDRAEELFDDERQDLLGESIWELFPEAVGGPYWEKYTEAMSQQKKTTLEAYDEDLEGWFEVNIYPSETGLSVYFRDITEKKRRKENLSKQREQIAALDNLNRVVRHINDAVIDRSTRAETNRAIVETLTDSESYDFAWIGDVDRASEVVTLECHASTDDDRTVTLDTEPAEDAAEDDDPVVAALRTHEIQVCQGFDEPSPCEPWGTLVDEQGLCSFAVIPLCHEETIYGLLTVYATRSHAFSPEEREVIAHLGDTVGHAFAANERKRALMSDEITELLFEAPDFFDVLDQSVPTDGYVKLERLVPQDNNSFIQYCTAANEMMPAMEAIVDSEKLSHWQSLRVDWQNDSETRFELKVVDPPVLSLVASHGGYVDGARIVDGDLDVRIHLSPSHDVRHIAEQIQETHPDMRLRSRKQIPREDVSVVQLERTLAEDLTDQQLAALEVAYYGGYFQWPRDQSGDELSDTMDISPPTFHQHLRNALRILLENTFEGREGTRQSL